MLRSKLHAKKTKKMVKLISRVKKSDDARIDTVQRRAEKKAILTITLGSVARKMLQGIVQSLAIIITLIHYHVLCRNTDTITSSTVLTDPDSIDSSNKQFSLGFFSPSGTTNRYLGIWYYVSPEIITWVANRENPLEDSSGSVSISSDGNIVLTNGKKEVVWSSYVTPDSNATSAQISNAGNLVLSDGSSGSVLWESNKHPVDTLLPTMRVSHNPRTGEGLVLNSWKNIQDPSPGNFTCGLQAHGIPQIYVWDKGMIPIWRSGPWNGRVLTGVVNKFPMYVNGFSMETSDDGTVYFGKSLQEKFLTRNYLNSDGVLVEATWDVQNKDWNVSWSAPRDECDYYNKCGLFAVCFSKDEPVCSCLKGYEPKNRDEWGNGIWRSGCKRRTSLQCERENGAMDKNRADGFSRLSFVKVPDFMVWIDGLENECESLCMKNCSCLAYGYDPGIGCMYWSGDLIDIQKFDGNAGTDLYVRVAYSELDKVKKKKSNIAVIAASVISSFAAALICLFLFYVMRKRIGRSVDFSSEKRRRRDHNLKEDGVNIEELPLFSYEKLANATNNFDIAYKLGMGGFGPVYKGKLENGKEIAVKRLSAVSGQGVEEFMNEVVVISKLQHRNLVRLLGCCVEKGEKMLVYEYLPNKSLDVILFDSKQDVLDWKKRFDIIEAIGRGLLYLHRDSRLKIIHRDLKPSNILLDEHWMPKISDFGMARIFGGNQDQANTAKVVGTYGYMAPEYAVWGRFSEKSDVFSFGVLLLEIVSGKRNTRFYNDELSLGLLGYAWKLWNEGELEDFIDVRISSLGNYKKEITRCINIGLLCVQESPQKRPSISTVVSMLISEIVELPKPEHPGFTDTVSSSLMMVESSSSTQNQSSNRVTLTVLEGR